MSGNGLPAPLSELVGKKLYLSAGLYGCVFGALCFVLPLFQSMFILGGSAESCNNSCAFFIRLCSLVEIINGIAFLLVANDDKQYSVFVITGFWHKVLHIFGGLVGFQIFGVVGFIGFLLDIVPNGLIAFLLFKELQTSGTFEDSLTDIKAAVQQAIEELKLIIDGAKSGATKKRGNSKYEGQQFHDDNTGGVYVKLDGVLRHIPNPRTYGLLFRTALDASQPHMKHITTPQLNDDAGDYVLGEPLTDGASVMSVVGSEGIYLACDGVKRHITSPAVMDKYLFSWEAASANKVSSDAAAAMPTGSPIS